MADKKVLDLTDVKEGGAYSRRHVEDGEYPATITGVVDQQSKAGDDMWVFTIKLDNVSRATYPYYAILNAKNLWKVAALFKAAGKPLPRKRGAVDPNTIVGRKVGVSMVEDEYNGRINSVVDDIFSASELPSATVETGDEVEVLSDEEILAEPVIGDEDDDELVLDLDDD